jgi:hypothetical protein
MMFPWELKSLGFRRYGDDWERKLSAATGVNLAAIRLWKDNKALITPQMELLIRRICEAGERG